MAVISDPLMSILQCPETRQRLTLADAERLEQINRAIAAGELRNRGGDRLERPLDGALVREDQALFYPVLDRIPILLADEAVLFDQRAENR